MQAGMTQDQCKPKPECMLTGLPAVLGPGKERAMHCTCEVQLCCVLRLLLVAAVPRAGMW
jgi:hypothetical protein